MKIKSLIIISLFALGLWVRFYQFPDKVIFTLEQGITLQTTHDYIHSKFSLLGLPNVQRFTSDGLRIFSGPLYNYALIPIMSMFGNDPITLTYFALFINLTTAILMYVLIKDLGGRLVAVLATIFFLFNPTMIEQSLTIWILNPLPLLGLLSMYLILKHKDKIPGWVVFSLGMLSGTSISLEYMCLVTSIFIGLYLFHKSENKLNDSLLFVFGATIPLSPTLVFDLRNDWYHLHTLWQYAIDTIHNPGQGSPRAYHFFHLYPLWFYFLGYMTSILIRNQHKVIGYSMVGLYVLYGSVISTRIKPIVSVNSLLELGSTIAIQAEPNYNVVYMPQAEYRAYALRYILTVIHNKPPLPIDAYPSSSELYVITTPDRNLDTDIPWEISTFKPTKKEIISTSSDNQVLLYKLSK